MSEFFVILLRSAQEKVDAVIEKITANPFKSVAVIVALVSLLFLMAYCSGKASAHGYQVVAPVVEVVAPTAPAPVPAGPGSWSAAPAFIGIGIIAAFVFYCMASKDKEYCEEQETPTFPK